MIAMVDSIQPTFNSIKSRRSVAAHRVLLKTVPNSRGSQKLRQLIETAEEVISRLLATDRDRDEREIKELF
jgi:hypothetical protein